MLNSAYQYLEIIFLSVFYMENKLRCRSNTTTNNDKMDNAVYHSI